MRLTVLLMLLPLSLPLAACGGGGSASTAAETAAASQPTATAPEIPSLEERAQLFAYDASTPKVSVKGKKTEQAPRSKTSRTALQPGTSGRTW
jgi:curli biogenesis system outer membrane secretion channel CsgG